MIHTGVIGTGSMGRNHLRVVDSLPEFSPVAAVDVDPGVTGPLAELYRGVQWEDDYRRIADMVDAVVVATPTESHHEICRFFLEKGKHVLVEKPVTRSVEEARDLIALAKSRGLCFSVGHLERFNPAVLYADEVVSSPLFIEVQRLGPFSSRSVDVDVIMDLMIHDLDIILHWDNSGWREIKASGIPIISGKIDICNVRIEFESGMVANMTASRVSQKKTRKLRVFQKNRYLSIDYKKRRVKSFALNDGEIEETLPDIPDEEPLKNLWRMFARSLGGDSSASVTGEEGLKALALARSIAREAGRKP